MESLLSNNSILALLSIFVVAYSLDQSMRETRFAKELNALELRKEMQCTEKLSKSQQDMLVAFKLGAATKGGYG